MSKKTAQGKHRKIPPKYESLMKELEQEGKTQAEIHAVLVSHGVDCHPSTVHRTLARLKAEKAETARGIYAEEAAKTAASDVAIINQTIEEVIALRAAAKASGDARKYQQLSSELRNWVQLRISLTGGLSAKDFADDEEDDIGILEKLDLFKKGLDVSEKN